MPVNTMPLCRRSDFRLPPGQTHHRCLETPPAFCAGPPPLLWRRPDQQPQIIVLRNAVSSPCLTKRSALALASLALSSGGTPSSLCDACSSPLEQLQIGPICFLRQKPSTTLALRVTALEIVCLSSGKLDRVTKPCYKLRAIRLTTSAFTGRARSFLSSAPLICSIEH
jgi:hypothetical protein